MRELLLFTHHLVLQGSVSETSLEGVRRAFSAKHAKTKRWHDWPATTRCLFVGFSELDVPIGQRFDAVFPWANPLRGDEPAEPTTAILIASTDGRMHFDRVPKGHRQLCVFDFPTGVPALVDALPCIDSWQTSTMNIGLRWLAP